MSTRRMFAVEDEGFALVGETSRVGRSSRPGTGTQIDLVSRQVDAGKLAEMAERERLRRVAGRRPTPEPTLFAAPISSDYLDALAELEPSNEEIEPEPEDLAEAIGMVGELPETEIRPVGLARREFVDAATGQRVPPAPLDRAPDGAAPTGAWADMVAGELVTVDAADLVEPPPREHPRRQLARYERGPQHVERAREAKRARKPKRVSKPRSVRATFDTPAKAAALFYDANEQFLDAVPDPGDGLRDWADGVDVPRKGGKSARLVNTPAGQAILGARQGAPQIRKALAYVFGRARGRRWDAVDWREIDRLELALQPLVEGDDAAPGFYWRPVAGDYTSAQIADLSPDERDRLATWEAAEELRLALSDLRVAYERSRKCMKPAHRKIVERRISEFARWAEDPRTAPASACDPDPRTGGATCDYPSIAGEVRALARACETGYDPDWPVERSRGGELGFPDTSFGPPDPKPKAKRKSAPRQRAGTVDRKARAQERKRRAKERSAKRAREAARCRATASGAKARAAATTYDRARADLKRAQEAARKAAEQARAAERAAADLERQAARDGLTETERRKLRQTLRRARCLVTTLGRRATQLATEARRAATRAEREKARADRFGRTARAKRAEAERAR